MIIPKLTQVPKQFIPSNGSSDVSLNLVLKNNFTNGSYLFEFFDEEKTILKNFSLSDFEKINVHIKSLLPLDLNFVSERIGNIVFQLPVTVLNVNHRGLEKWEGIEVNIAWHPKLKKSLPHKIQVIGDLDDTITGFRYIDGDESGCYQIGTGNSSSKNKIVIFNPENELILYSFTGNLIGKIAIDMHLDLGIEPRTINVSGKTETVKLTYMEQQRIGFKEMKYVGQIQKRVFDSEKKTLEQRGAINQFCKNGNKERARAINDVRKLVSRLGKKHICLWDPYVTYEDILNTLYFSSVVGAELRAIGSFTETTQKIVTKGMSSTNKVDFPTWKAEQIDGFINSSNNVGVNLEFRCKHGIHGWDFHDRFLLFPAETSNDTPHVWSLGSSVNSLGNRHHIVQEVPYAKIIIEAFEQLWSALNKPECLVWRSK